METALKLRAEASKPTGSGNFLKEELDLKQLKKSGKNNGKKAIKADENARSSKRIFEKKNKS